MDSRIKFFSVIQGNVFSRERFLGLLIPLPYQTLLLLLFLINYYYYFLSRFLENASADFYKTFRSYSAQSLYKIIFFFSPHFRSRDIKDCIFLLVHNFFPNVLKDSFFKFSGMVESLYPQCITNIRTSEGIKKHLFFNFFVLKFF